VTLAVFGSGLGLPKDNLPRTVPGKARDKFFADLTETLVLTYEMNGRSWTRTGQNQPELVFCTAARHCSFCPLAAA